MSYMMSLLMAGLLLGMIVVASNPSPYFGALGVMVVSGMGCGLLVMSGSIFLSLVLFLIYLGGMLVVFAYSSALSSDLYPEALGSRGVAVNSIIYVLGTFCGWICICDSQLSQGEGPGVGGGFEISVVRAETGGVALTYCWGGETLVLVGWALLITLFVVLEIVRAGQQGALRAV